MDLEKPDLGTPFWSLGVSMQVEVYKESEKALWDEFVGKSKNGTFLFYRDYMDYHNDRFEDHSLIIWDDKDRLIALLPANREGTKLISHGGLTYGGFVTDETMKTAVMLDVFKSVITFLTEHSVGELVYKTIPHIYHRIPAEEDLYALFMCKAELVRRDVLTVCDSKNRLPFQERRRRSVKKAIKNGLIVKESNRYEQYWAILEENLNSAYSVRPVHAISEICLLQSRFPDNIKLFGCFKGEAMTGGVVIYESDKVAHVQYIAADGQGKSSGALDLIFDFLLTDFYIEKLFFDFGASNGNDGRYLNKGVIDQKEGFGARAVVHDHYIIDFPVLTRTI